MVARLLARLPRLRTESEDFLHLDALRFIAAAGVVLFHMMGELRLSPFGEGVLKHLVALNLFVDLFFVISGIVIAHVYGGRIRNAGDYASFLHKRIARLAPLHWLTLAAFIVIQAWLQPARFAKLDWSCVAPTAAFLHAVPVCKGLRFNFPSWSIGAEMMLYAALPLLLIPGRKSRWAPFALAGIALIGLYAVGKAGPIDRPWWEWTFDFGVLRALPAFLLGLGLYGIRDLLGRLPAPRLWLAAAIGAVALGMAFSLHKGALVLMIYAVAATALAADLQKTAGPAVRAFAPLGQLTYSLYMLHAFALLFFVQYLPRRTGLSHNFLIGVSFPLLLILSYISLFAFEQPMRRWISGWGRRKAGGGGGAGLVSSAHDLPAADFANYAPGVTPPIEAAPAPGRSTAPAAQSGEPA